MTFKENLIIEEYKTLREEIKTNSKFVFERPLLIAATALLAKDYFTSKITNEISLALPATIAILVLLFFNLWFTYNRLNSNARIIAYINVFLESEKRKKWIGWENSLVKYRELKPIPKKRNPKIEKLKTQFDSRRFYGNIFYFHLFLATFVVILNIIINNPFAVNSFNFYAGIVLILLYAGFCITAFINWNPNLTRYSIGKEIIKWLYIAEEI